MSSDFLFMGKQSKVKSDGSGQFTSMESAIEAVRQGKLVIVADDERRENEGDLIIAAEKVTPEAINFMAKFGRGLICVALEADRLARLGLARMVPHTGGDIYRTAFMESVDARHGITTGISAHDRAHTVRVLMDNHSTAADLVRPGHMFPLEAVSGGVLKRPGHTEAAVDLARIAGLKPAGVICEVLRDDGTMARLPDLFDFARTHNVPMISVSAIATYRKKTEKLITLEEQINLPTDLGIFKLRMYRSHIDDKHHLALVMGEPWTQESAYCRVHSECLTGDAFGSLRCDCGSQLREAMQMIAREGHGVLVYLRQEGRGIGLEQKIKAYALQEKGFDTVEANEQLGFEADMRDYSIAAQILRDLDIHKIRLITNNPLKVTGLEDYDIDVQDRVPLIQPSTIYNEGYMETKRTKMGHML